MNRIRLVACALACTSPSFAAPDLSTFAIDPRLKMELFAAEPDIVDPVALTFDEAGRMYAVEMRDYPYGIGPENKPGGTIRLLEDTNGDGKADKSTLFAADLSFPTSIAPWNGGVFVTAPPEIIYLKDTDDDGVADQRLVYFTGFVLGVTDSNVNGLRWGLDNRLHGLNGGNGGRINAVQPPGTGSSAVRARRGNTGGLPFDLGQADFSFDPSSLDFDKTYESSGGFGLVFDEFGRSFVTHNINHIQQRIIPVNDLNRFPGMFSVDATQSISDHGDMARIYPISVAQTRPNHPEQAGHFSAAGGLGFIGYDAYPEDLYRSVTVGDAVGNLLHRDVLHTNSPVFQARRSLSETNREFLASRDPNCRLVGLELGPDGALYVIDMQRDVIEHPDYIPEKMLKTLDIRAGENRGRIYRISPKAGLPKALKLSELAPDQLVAELEHHNQWQRMTAQRLLVEKNARSVGPKLAGLAQRSRFIPARVHAFWTLDALGELHPSVLQAGLRDPHAEVREVALQLAERYSGRGVPIEPELARMVNDPSPRVRFQLALALGGFNSSNAQDALVKLLVANRESYWIKIAALSSLRSPADAFPIILQRLNSPKIADDLDLIRDIADLAMARSDHPAGRLVELLAALEKADPDSALAGVEGLDRGLARRGLNQPRLAIQPTLARLGTRNDELFAATWQLGNRLGLTETRPQQQALQKAIRAAINPTSARQAKLTSIRLLRFGRFADVREALAANLGGIADAELQAEALKSTAAFREPAVAEMLVSRWAFLSPGLRNRALNLLVSRRPFHDALLTGIENGTLLLGELNLDLEQRRALLRHSTPDIRQRASKFIGDEEYSNRKAVVDEWLATLPQSGDAARGQQHFEKLCAQCHRAGDIGSNVGPDLTSISHRSVEDILYNILDPGMAINPRYTAYQVETKEGDLITGIVEQETPEAITLLQASELRTTIPRNQIVHLKSTGTSLMPEGLESGVAPQEMRDLIAYLQEPR